MVGNIYIVGQHLANGADNRVLTATSAYGMNGESALTFDGNDLTQTITSNGGHTLTSTGNHAIRITGNTNRSAENNTLLAIRAQWNNTQVAMIDFQAGDDTTNKDNSKIGFYTAPAGTQQQHMLIESNGNVKINDGNLVMGTSGKGIDFSATANAGNSASTGSELFDDYEEGSWTPHLVSSAGNMSTTSFSLHQGTYTKIGRLVYITGVMYGPRSSGGTGNLRISNLPYAVRNGDHAQLLTKDYQFSNYPTNFGHISGYGMNNTTQINLFKREGSSQAGLPLSWWSTSANDYMYFNMTYTTDT